MLQLVIAMHKLIKLIIVATFNSFKHLMHWQLQIKTTEGSYVVICCVLSSYHDSPLYQTEVCIGFVSNKYILSRSWDFVHILALQYKVDLSVIL